MKTEQLFEKYMKALIEQDEQEGFRRLKDN